MALKFSRYISAAGALRYRRSFGLPVITAKSIDNVISNDKTLAGMNPNRAEMLDLTFLERLAAERKAKQR